MRCPRCGKMYPANQTVCKTCYNQKLVSEEQYKQGKTNSNNNQHIPKCPICGSADLKKLDALDRGFSAFMFGLGSNKIGKTYQCKNCKSTF